MLGYGRPHGRKRTVAHRRRLRRAELERPQYEFLIDELKRRRTYAAHRSRRELHRSNDFGIWDRRAESKWLPIVPEAGCMGDGLPEPGAGSDLANLSMRAELDGDQYILNGSKI